MIVQESGAIQMMSKNGIVVGMRYEFFNSFRLEEEFNVDLYNIHSFVHSFIR